jgi:hypothetical protein
MNLKIQIFLVAILGFVYQNSMRSSHRTLMLKKLRVYSNTILKKSLKNSK